MKSAVQVAAMMLMFVFLTAGSLAQAASLKSKKAGVAKNELFLSTDEFLRLPQQLQAEYIGEVRKFLVEAEKSNPNKYSDLKTRMPSWFWEVAVADAETDKICFVAGWSLQKRNGRCPIESNIKCVIGGNPGVVCNPAVFFYEPPANTKSICVEEFDPGNRGERNGITGRCDTKSKQLHPDRDQKIAAKIATDADFKTSFETVETSANAKCSSVPRQIDEGLCRRMQRITGSVRSKIPASTVATTTTPGTPTEIVDQVPVPPKPEQAQEQAQEGIPEGYGREPESDRCRSAAELEESYPVFCQFKTKKDGRYFSIRYADSSKKNLEIWEASNAAGDWCKPDSGTPKSLFKGEKSPGQLDVQKKGKDTCGLDIATITTNIFTKKGKTESFRISRAGHNVYECNFDDIKGSDELGKNDKEDFIMGIDLSSSEFGRLAPGLQNGPKPETMSSKLLRQAERNNARDAFKFDDDKVGCPDDSTRNLAYALIAAQSLKNCYVQDTRVVSRSGSGEGSADGAHVRIQTKLGGAGSENLSIRFRTHKDENGKRGQSIGLEDPGFDLTQPRRNVTAAQWFYGDKKENGAYKDTAGIYSQIRASKSQACQDTAPAQRPRETTGEQ